MERTAQQPPLPRHSPCVGVCTLDQATGWCLGCGRSGDEIARWATMGEANQLACWAELPRRLDLLSVQAHLLPWTVEELATWVASTLATEYGTWVTGVPGAIAEFPCGSEHGIEIARDCDLVTGRTSKATFRLRLHDKLRAFGFGPGAPIVLGLPKTRVTLPVADTLTSLGSDTNATDSWHRTHQLFDLGLGRQGSRFCIRTDDPVLTVALREQCGLPWSMAIAAIGPMILSSGSHRVVESTLARVEVFTPIPAPGRTTPPGAHTHFLPAFLKPGEEVPAGLNLPDYALPMAIYYPPPS
ncbi:MAG: DUF1289 domain-containing protein [Methyloceanibacter sp.]